MGRGRGIRLCHPGRVLRLGLWRGPDRTLFNRLCAPTARPCCRRRNPGRLALSGASGRWVAALSLLIGAAPVGATESMDCSREGEGAPSVGLAIGHAAEQGVANAYFSDGKQEIKV